MSHPGGVAFAWYFHLPDVADDHAVEALAQESLEPLLRTHAQTRVPFSLCITGALLARLRRTQPAIIGSIRSLQDDDLVSIAGSFYYEVLPHLLPAARLARHLAADLELKAAVFDCQCDTFMPANFAWDPRADWLLRKSGIRLVVLDGRHLRHATDAQSWRWDPSRAGMATAMLPTGLDDWELGTTYAIPNGDDPGAPPLAALFRNVELTDRWIASTDSALFRPWEPTVFEGAIADLQRRARDGCVLLAGDGDRVGPLTVYTYERLLERIGSKTHSLEALGSAAPPNDTLGYLPAFALGAIDAFWLRNADALAYLRLLEDAWSLVERGRLDPHALMPFEDVYALFWSNVAGKSRCVGSLTRMVMEAARDDPHRQ